MILEICLSTRADRNDSCRSYYASPEEVESGVHVDWMLPSQYREYVKSIYVKTSADGEHVEVESQYGSAKFPIDRESMWHSGSIGLSYACCEISITFVPYIRDYWDVLLTTHGGVTSMIARDELQKGVNLSALRPALDGTPMPGMDLEVCYMADDKLGLYCGQKHSDFLCVRLHGEPVHRDGVSLALETFSTVITEWDDVEEKPVRCIVDTRDLGDSLTDKDAALRIAESVEEQYPEMLELVAKYMGFAADLGQEDAIAWLRDYYEEDDARYHAYD
jgi:hypothetical protein